RRNCNDRLIVFAARLFPVNREPTRIDNDLTIGFKGLAFDSGNARGHLELCRRIENRDGPARDHIENLSLKFVETRRRSVRWNDCVVIALLWVIEHALGRPYP